MKPKVEIIQGRLKGGRTGIQYRHNIKVGDRVQVRDGRKGRVVAPGLAGMPEVKFEDGSSCLFTPTELQIIN